MTVRKFSAEKDWPMLCSWWKGHGQKPQPLELLSVDGVVVEARGGAVFAGWLISTNVAYAFLESFVSNPAATLRERSEALDILILTLQEVAKERGFTHVLALAENKGMAKRFIKRHGGRISNPSAVALTKKL